MHTDKLLLTVGDILVQSKGGSEKRKKLITNTYAYRQTSPWEIRGYFESINMAKNGKEKTNHRHICVQTDLHLKVRGPDIQR